MKQRSFIIVALSLALVLISATALYVYDSGNDDTIANGVTVAGVPVGGLSAQEAREKVTARVAKRLERPIAVTHGKQRFTLSASDAGIRVDVGGMVDAALGASRDGNIFARVLRDATGGEEDAAIAPKVSYSAAAVDALVARVGKALDEPARDATLDFPSLARVKERDGIKVRREALEREIATVLRSAADDREVAAPVRRTEPKVTREQLAERYPVLLIADRSNFRLNLYKNLKLAKSYTVAVGAVGFDTPAGLYNIQNKGENVAWTVPNSDWAGDLAGKVIPGGVPENPLKARWLGIYAGAGIHGTDQTSSLGSAASHGCIRMAIPDVIELYPQVPVGAPIYIA